MRWATRMTWIIHSHMIILRTIIRYRNVETKLQELKKALSEAHHVWMQTSTAWCSCEQLLNEGLLLLIVHTFHVSNYAFAKFCPFSKLEDSEWKFSWKSKILHSWSILISLSRRPATLTCGTRRAVNNTANYRTSIVSSRHASCSHQ